MTYAIEVQNVTKCFGGVRALSEVSMSIKQKEFMILFGPSGSGKSTLLDIISGLEHPSEGTVLIDGKDVGEVRPYNRGVGVAFQNGGLYAHLSVKKNIEIGVRKRFGGALPSREMERRIVQAAQSAHLPERLLRVKKMSELSGGERQRVTLAKIFASRCKNILWDEPLASVDAILRRTLREEIKAIHEHFGAASLYVTHDREDVFALADRVTVMMRGRVLQVGTPEELYRNPSSFAVGELFGRYNDNVMILTRTKNGKRQLCHPDTPDAQKICVRPEEMEVSDDTNGIKATVGQISMESIGTYQLKCITEHGDTWWVTSTRRLEEKDVIRIILK